MTPLRKKMIDAMQVRGFSPRTHASYLWAVADLARYYHRSPDRISLQEIERYFLYLVQERHLADSSCRLYLHGLRFLYLQVCTGRTSMCRSRTPSAPTAFRSY